MPRHRRLFPILLVFFTISCPFLSASQGHCRPVLTWAARIGILLPRWVPYRNLLFPTKLSDLALPSVKGLDSSSKAALTTALKNFLVSSDELMAHVAGDFSESGKLIGGHHDVRDRVELLRQITRNLRPSSGPALEGILRIEKSPLRSLVGTHNSPQFAEEVYEETLRVMKAFGLDPEAPEDRVVYFLLQEGAIGRPEVSHNGVVKYRFNRNFFTSKGYKLYSDLAEHGLAPMGAKTFFPIEWDENTVSAAVQSILKNPKSRVASLSLDGNGKFKGAVLEGVYKGVVVKVSIYGDKVVSAYPSWEQNLDRHIGEYVQQGQVAISALEARLENLITHEVLPRGVFLTGEQAIDIYLGKDLDGFLPPTQLAAVREILCPQYYVDGHHRGDHSSWYYGTSFIDDIYDILEARRVVESFHGQVLKTFKD